MAMGLGIQDVMPTVRSMPWKRVILTTIQHDQWRPFFSVRLSVGDSWRHCQINFFMFRFITSSIKIHDPGWGFTRRWHSLIPFKICCLMSLKDLQDAKKLSSSRKTFSISRPEIFKDIYLQRHWIEHIASCTPPSPHSTDWSCSLAQILQPGKKASNNASMH
jgi:hypothetical protein